MAAAWNRINSLLLLLVLFSLLAVIGMLAAGVRGGPLDPLGAPGSTDSVKLPGTPIDAPAVINQSGHYYLTRNITVPTDGGIGILINANDVTVDLGGFTISGAGIDENAFNVNGARVRISNGIVRDAVAVEAPGAVDLHITGIAAYNGPYYAFRVGGGAVLEDCIISGYGSGGELGIRIEGPRATVRRCVIEGNTQGGINIAQGADGVLIEDSVIKGNNTAQNPNGGGIVTFDTDETTVRGNDLNANNVADVYVFGLNNVVVDNIITCPTSIVLGPGSTSTFAPVNSTDPHTNRAHRAAC